MIEIPIWLFVGLLFAVAALVITNARYAVDTRKAFEAWKKSCDSSHEMDQEILAEMKRYVEAIEKSKPGRPKCVICGFSKRAHMINAMDHEYLEKPQ